MIFFTAKFNNKYKKASLSQTDEIRSDFCGAMYFGILACILIIAISMQNDNDIFRIISIICLIFNAIACLICINAGYHKLTLLMKDSDVDKARIVGITYNPITAEIAIEMLQV